MLLFFSAIFNIHVLTQYSHIHIINLYDAHNYTIVESSGIHFDVQYYAID